MIVTDKVTGQKWELFVNDGQVGYRQVAPPYIGDYVPVRVEESVNWEFEMVDSQLGVTNTGLTPMYPWVRDEADPNTVWEFRSDGGQLYIAQLSLTGIGIVKYLLTGKVFEVSNLCGGVTEEIDLSSPLLQELGLTCLVPQEEFI